MAAAKTVIRKTKEENVEVWQQDYSTIFMNGFLIYTVWQKWSVNEFILS